MRRTALLLLLLTIALSAGAKQRFSYVVNRGHDSGISLMHGELQDALRLRRELGGGRYLWARLDGREYLIRDVGVMAEVERALSAHDALQPEVRALRAKMDPLERRVDRLEEQIDAITDRDDEEISRAEEDRVRTLEQQVRVLERELREYEHEERRLDDKEEVLDKVLDAEMERIVRRAIRNGTAGRAD